MRRRAFLVCPVRGHDPDELMFIVTTLEGQGWDVHYPPKDTEQQASELRICADNRRAIERAEMVFVVWDGLSQGCLFDLGMAFALHKSVTIIELPAPTVGKSFQSMVRAWEQTGPSLS